MARPRKHAQTAGSGTGTTAGGDNSVPTGTTTPTRGRKVGARGRRAARGGTQARNSGGTNVQHRGLTFSGEQVAWMIQHGIVGQGRARITR